MRDRPAGPPTHEVEAKCGHLVKCHRFAPFDVWCPECKAFRRSLDQWHPRPLAAGVPGDTP